MNVDWFYQEVADLKRRMLSLLELFLLWSMTLNLLITCSSLLLMNLMPCGEESKLTPTKAHLLQSRFKHLCCVSHLIFLLHGNLVNSLAKCKERLLSLLQRVPGGFGWPRNYSGF